VPGAVGRDVSVRKVARFWLWDVGGRARFDLLECEAVRCRGSAKGEGWWGMGGGLWSDDGWLRHSGGVKVRGVMYVFGVCRWPYARRLTPAVYLVVVFAWVC